MTRLSIDWETKSELNITDTGVDLYSRHPSTKVLMAAYRFDDDEPEQWVPAEGERMPSDLKEALRDPSVTKWAFNAPFERWITAETLGIETDISSWRCTMALAYMYSFLGGLDDVTKQMGLKETKDPRGKLLIRTFCQPNKPTRNQPFVWRDRHSDPELWEEFKLYNRKDEVAEHGVFKNLIGYAMPEWQWELYALDQKINDRGLPINRRFVQNALEIADRRKRELIVLQNQMTGLANSNSGTQLLPWLQDRGYPYSDLQKDTISKVLANEEILVKGGVIEPYLYHHGRFGQKSFPGATVDSLGRVVGDAVLDDDARQVLRMRQYSSKTSTTKYEAAMSGLAEDDRLRHCFQYAGASRTNRWAGRKIQPQNLPRTPKWLEPWGDDPKFDFDPLDYCNELINEGDYFTLGLWAGDQMDAVAGCVRSSIQASEGKRLVVCDLSSIESVVIGWLTDCERLLNVFRGGKCAYKDFATTLYSVSYEEVTKGMRSGAKPAVLGAGYRLSGGDMRDGKKTGLWGYAENMGIALTKDESQRAVEVFREAYHEIPSAWYAIENAIERAMRAGGRPVKWGPLTFEVKKPFLRVILPSGRPMYYYKLRTEKQTAISRRGNEYEKTIISYMGKDQVTQQWTRIESHGGKFIENLVQAIARDILAFGAIEADAAGFYLVGHVHDELICEQDEDDDVHDVDLLRQCMTTRIQAKHPWMANMPLGAAGYTAKVYRKD